MFVLKQKTILVDKKAYFFLNYFIEFIKKISNLKPFTEN